VRTRAALFTAVLSACLAWSAPAGAAQVGGTLQVTDVARTTVSFTTTVARTCVTDEQCDYFSELDQVDGDGTCPAAHPADPWITWTGNVQNTGPATETATITPRGWGANATAGTSRLCLYTYADLSYYLVAGTTVTQPPPPPGGGGGGGGGTPGAPGAPGSPTPPGGSPSTLSCDHYTYRQSAQKALDAARLDRNGDGVACPDLPLRLTTVRTVGTAAAATATATALRHAYGTAFARRAGYKARCARRSRTRMLCTVSWRYKGTYKGTVEVVGVIRKNRQAVLTHVKVKRPAKKNAVRAAAG
jgi:hypothetical protein